MAASSRRAGTKKVVHPPTSSWIDGFLPELPDRLRRHEARAQKARFGQPAQPKAQIAERQREANRLHKALEDTGIKLDCVASDILGVSGRAMLDALVSGTTDPVVLAELSKGRLRAKIHELTEALEGRFEDLHSLLIGSILAHLDFLDTQIEALSEAIEAKLAPFATGAVELLCTIPGVGERTAQNVIAEIGVDMSVFLTAGHLASWARQCPATTSPPANAAQAGPARAPNGSTSRSKKLPWAPSAPTTATSKRSTAATRARAAALRGGVEQLAGHRYTSQLAVPEPTRP